MMTRQSQWLGRAGALASAAAVTLTTLVATATPAQSHPAGDRAVEAGAAWLTGQLTDGLVHNDQFGGFDDYGLSADFAFALEEVGKDATASAVVDAIEPKSESWVAGGPGRVYAGSLAKMVSLVQATGQDATAYNGTNQVTRLANLVSSSAPVSGRLEDAGVNPVDPWDADFVNVIGQSFASRALTTAGSSRAADATGFLLDQQCNEGFFRATLTADKTSTQQGCVSGIDTGSIDTTALTIVNILATPGASTRAKGAAALAASWLKTQQAPDGSFTAGGAEGYNANSTGLAGWALAEAGDTASATKAAAWLRGVQIADLAPCATTLTADNGALAFKPDLLSAARTSGIAPGARDQYRRATAQALPALAHVPAAAGAAPAISAPTTAVEKTTVTVTVAGLGAGEPACVSFGSQAKQVTGAGAALGVTFDLPAGVATHTFRLATLAGVATASTSATASPPAPAPAPAPQVGTLDARRVVKVARNRFSVELTCGSDVACAGKVVVRTAGKVRVAPGKRVVVTMAKRTYSVAANGEKTLVLKVTKRGRALLEDGRVRVRAVQTAPGAERAVTKFWLKAVRG
jgi:hypothetical protein